MFHSVPSVLGYPRLWKPHLGDLLMIAAASQHGLGHRDSRPATDDAWISEATWMTGNFSISQSISQTRAIWSTRILRTVYTVDTLIPNCSPCSSGFTFQVSKSISKRFVHSRLWGGRYSGVQPEVGRTIDGPPGIQNIQTPPVGQVETIWETLKIALLNGTDQRVPRPRRIESALPIEKPSAPLPKVTDSLLPSGFHCLQGKKPGRHWVFRKLHNTAFDFHSAKWRSTLSTPNCPMDSHHSSSLKPHLHHCGSQLSWWVSDPNLGWLRNFHLGWPFKTSYGYSEIYGHQIMEKNMIM